MLSISKYKWVECTYILAVFLISTGTQSSEKHQEHNDRDEKKEHKDVSNNNVISFDWHRIGFVVSKKDLYNASACSYLDNVDVLLTSSFQKKECTLQERFSIESQLVDGTW